MDLALSQEWLAYRSCFREQYIYRPAAGPLSHSGISPRPIERAFASLEGSASGPPQPLQIVSPQRHGNNATVRVQRRATRLRTVAVLRYRKSQRRTRPRSSLVTGVKPAFEIPGRSAELRSGFSRQWPITNRRGRSRDVTGRIADRREADHRVRGPAS